MIFWLIVLEGLSVGAVSPSYKGHRYPVEVISHCVWLYLGEGAGRVFIEHEEYENGAGKLSRHGEAMSTDSLGSLGRAKGAFGRTRGRDPFTQAFDSVLHGALNARRRR
jgi:hypothetical protein